MISSMTDGRNIGERVKSACILALVLIIITMYAMTLKDGNSVPVPIVESSVETSGESIIMENPIDAFFAKVEAENLTSITQREFANIYLDCWEQELTNAYRVLQEETGLTRNYPEGYIMVSMEAYMDYAEAQGWMEAYYRNAYGADEGFYSEYIYAKAELIREQTLRIYAMMQETVEATDFGNASPFIFSKEDAKGTLVRYGLQMDLQKGDF